MAPAPQRWWQRMSPTRPGWWLPVSYDRFREALACARTEEKVRGFIALVLVGVLLALLFKTPSGPHDEVAPAVASAKTLAIAVIAFYFGLHGDTPQGETKAERMANTEAARTPPKAPAGAAAPSPATEPDA
jgi:hypothetical protein